MITVHSTLQEVMANPMLKGKEYMVDPGLDDFLAEALNGRRFSELKFEDYKTYLPDWIPEDIAEGMQYLLEKCEKKKVFYDIWTEEEMEDEPSRKKTGIAAFPLEEKKKFVLICPGGGYFSVCAQQEGYPLAKKLNEEGYAAFILQYRVAENAGYPNPMDDLAKAVSFILEHAEKFNVETEDYAVMGFSAGGHLAATFGTENAGYKKYGLPKPSAVILGYPVITMTEKTHPGSRENLLGKENQTEASLKDFYSVEKHVTEAYPPVFVWQCEADSTVPAENSQMLVSELKKWGIPYLHEVFPGSAHGWGLGTATPAFGWLERAVEFWKQVSAAM